MYLDILNNLIEQTKVYRQINELSLEQKEIIVKNEQESLMEVTNKIRTLLKQARKVESQRQALVENTPFEKLSLSKIIDQCEDQELKVRLKLAKQQFTELIIKQKYLGDQINALLGINIQYFQYMIDNFAGSSSPTNYYNSNGYEDGGQRMGIFNSEV